MYSISETISIIINKILRNHKKEPLGIFTPMMLIIIPIVSNNEVRVGVSSTYESIAQFSDIFILLLDLYHISEV